MTPQPQQFEAESLLRCPSYGHQKPSFFKKENGIEFYDCRNVCPQGNMIASIVAEERWIEHEFASLKAAWRLDIYEAINNFRKLWDDAYPLEGTLAEIYLETQGFPVNGPISDIRFSPYNPLYVNIGTNMMFPIMLSKVSDVTGALVGLHRTFLSHDGRSKAPVKPDNGGLMTDGGCAVHLSPSSETLIVTENIESGLNIQRASGIPTWAALSPSGLEELILPPLPSAQFVFICPDYHQDGAGLRAAEFSGQALGKKRPPRAHHHAAEVRCVRGNTMEINPLLSNLKKLLPDGRVEGHDYVMLNPTRPDKSLGSFRINLHNGLWADFALDDPKARGKGIISLFAYVRGLPYKRAALELGMCRDRNGKTKRRATMT